MCRISRKLFFLSFQLQKPAEKHFKIAKGCPTEIDPLHPKVVICSFVHLLLYDFCKLEYGLAMNTSIFEISGCSKSDHTLGESPRMKPKVGVTTEVTSNDGGQGHLFTSHIWSHIVNLWCVKMGNPFMGNPGFYQIGLNATWESHAVYKCWGYDWHNFQSRPSGFHFPVLVYLTLFVKLHTDI